jgi:TRAP-type C4-dicarboxylate transport system permease small subunit
MAPSVLLRSGPPWFRFLNRILDGAAALFLAMAVAMLAFMLAANFANIVLRNSGHPSLLWVSPWTAVLMVWSVFLVFFVMYRRRLDIELTIVVDRLGRHGPAIARGLTASVGLVIAGVLVAEAPQILTRQRGTMEIVGLTRYWLSVPLLASSALLVLHFLAELAALAFGWTVGRPAGSAPGTETAQTW